MRLLVKAYLASAVRQHSSVKSLWACVPQSAGHYVYMYGATTVCYIDV